MSSTIIDPEFFNSSPSTFKYDSSYRTVIVIKPIDIFPRQSTPDARAHLDYFTFSDRYVPYTEIFRLTFGAPLASLPHKGFSRHIFRRSRPGGFYRDGSDHHSLYCGGGFRGRGLLNEYLWWRCIPILDFHLISCWQSIKANSEGRIFQ
jgi:hypothetical protein